MIIPVHCLQRPRHYPTVPLPSHLGVNAATSPPVGPIVITPSPAQPRPTSTTTAPPVMGMDPTAPPSENRNVGPPPIGGFVPRHAHPAGHRSAATQATPASPALVPVPLTLPPQQSPFSAPESSSRAPSASPLQ
jgi:hypothetical protein